jgi:hypothetical protein
VRNRQNNSGTESSFYDPRELFRAKQILNSLQTRFFNKLLGKETGQVSPKIMRFIIGNPLIMKEMAKHVPDARSYAPVTILVDERADGVRCELAVGERSCAVHNKVTDESLQETLLTQESSYNQIL